MLECSYLLKTKSRIVVVWHSEFRRHANKRLHRVARSPTGTKRNKIKKEKNFLAWPFAGSDCGAEKFNRLRTTDMWEFFSFVLLGKSRPNRFHLISNGRTRKWKPKEKKNSKQFFYCISVCSSHSLFLSLALSLPLCPWVKVKRSSWLGNVPFVCFASQSVSWSIEYLNLNCATSHTHSPIHRELEHIPMRTEKKAEPPR